MRRYAYGWVTALLFFGSLGLHWLFGWYSFVDEAAQHGQSPEVAAYMNEMARDTFENWQSEFLQLIWQVVGLAYLLYVGSPSSKENDDRLEAKVDALLRMVGGEEGGKLIEEFDRHYLRTEGHAQPHAHDNEIVRTGGGNVKRGAGRD